MTDPRLARADMWHRQHRWIERRIDEDVLESRYCLEQERRLREEVRREREVAETTDRRSYLQILRIMQIIPHQNLTLRPIDIE